MKRCCVPRCKTGYKDFQHIRRSNFKFPKDPVLRSLWAAAIPGNFLPKDNHYVCERHFPPDSIRRKYVKYDTNGKLLMEAVFLHPRLEKNAVPSIFEADDALPESSCPDQADERSRRVTSVSTNEMLDISCIEDPDLNVDQLCVLELTDDRVDSSHQEADNQGPEAERSYMLVDEFDPQDSESCMEFADTTDLMITSSQSNPEPCAAPIGEDIICTKEALTLSSPCKPSITDSAKTKKFINLRVISNSRVGDASSSFNLPNGWSVTEPVTTAEPTFVFCRTRIATDQKNTRVAVPKYIVLENSSGRTQYYVHGNKLRAETAELPAVIGDASSLIGALDAFDETRVCRGIDAVEDTRIKSRAYQDSSKSWRHNDCTLLTRTARCDACRFLQRRISRMHRAPSRGRINAASNAADLVELRALRRKCYSQTRTTIRAKHRVAALRSALKRKEDEIAALTGESLESKCAKLDIPDTQKITVRAIVKGDHTDPKERRYSEDWLLLCMLMYVRGASYYEFLRENDIIPLPCSKTLEDYFASVDEKYGFNIRSAERYADHYNSET